MTRFELMAPQKAGPEADRGGLGLQPRRPRNSASAARSVYWMLAAAGSAPKASHGALRVPGVMSIYARAFDTWLEDDDPGLARTDGGAR